MFSLSKNQNEVSKPKAYSYIRWSSAIQGDGDSDRRQTEQAEQYAAEHGLDLVPENIMRDEGKSAFTGKNLSDGEFGAFIQAIDEGRIEKGSYLLVEAHDRLSRQEPEQALQIFLNIISKGIVIVTLQDNIEYRTGQMDMMKLFGSIIKMSVAHEESDKKRKRGKANWEGKRLKAIAEGIKVSGICPSWLTLSKDKKSFIINETKAETIRRIFRLSLDGHGTYKIAQILNEENVPVLNNSNEWRADILSFLMKQRTLIGEYQPKKRIENTDKKIPVGEPIKGYYPAIISEADFLANRNLMDKRFSKGRGRKGRILSNIFSGLIKCDCCGGKMYTNKKSGLLYCKQVMNGVCDSRSWSYTRFEKAMLNFVNEIDLETVINGGIESRANEISSRINQLEGEKSTIDRMMEKYLILFDNNDLAPDMVKSKLNGWQKQLDEINENISSLINERLQVQEDHRLAKTEKVFSFPTDMDEKELYSLRAKASQHIKGIIEEIRFIRINGTIQGRLDKAGLDYLATGTQSQIDEGYDCRITVRFKGGTTRVLFPNSNDPSKAFHVLDMEQSGIAKAS